MSDASPTPDQDLEPLEFTPQELLWIKESRAALNELADWHVVKEVEADAMDCPESAKWHDKRRKLIEEYIGRLPEEEDDE